MRSVRRNYKMDQATSTYKLTKRLVFVTFLRYEVVYWQFVTDVSNETYSSTIRVVFSDRPKMKAPNI